MGKEVKVTIVGDSNVGKTCMCISYCTNTFPQEYVPTVFDNYTTKAVVEGNPIDLVLFDTAGDGDYDTIRPLNYPGSQCFLICFSVTQISSAEGVVRKWIEEVRAKCPDTPIMIVGTKIDLREDKKELESLKKDGKEPLTPQQGEQLAEAVGGNKYMECSALTQENLGKVFEEAIKFLYPPKSNPNMDKEKIENLKKSGCTIQ